MSIQKPGEIRCPTCGNSTPIAPFCTRCGADIPADAPVRPRGMDHDELESRIRQSRAPLGPFRRGAPANDQPGSAGWGPEPYVPEPGDLQARRDDDEPGVELPHIDAFREADPRNQPHYAAAPGLPQPGFSTWPVADLDIEPAPLRIDRSRDADQPAPPATPVPMPSYPRSTYSAADDGGYAAREHAGDEWTGSGGGSGDDGGYGGYGYGEPPRRRGSGALAVVGFVVLGLAALIGGALLSGILNTAAPLGAATASPTGTAAGATATSRQSESATPSGSAGPSAGSASPSPSGTPGPDNFTAKVQSCASDKMTFKGCTDDGSTITGDQVWIWVGFYQAAYNDVIGIKLVANASGEQVGDGSIQLQRDNIGCKPDQQCTGYLYFTFNHLDPGAYTIKVNRNGTDAAQVGFTVKA